ncbi:MAG: hypothetical protein DI529_08435 [Chryseobacterium sp.]|nr:MAG: hypothetical protein DI529_08435 [Chryseobacterium sp.]
MTLSLFSFSKNENNGHNGRCTGSAYCSACSNCSRCGHCSVGGTCGVCSGRKSEKSIEPDSYSKKSNTTKSQQNNKKSQSQKSPNVFDDSNIIKVTSSVRTTNIFEKPSFQSKVIENVSKNTELIQLSKLNSWCKVKIKESEKTGYVYYKDVK